MTWTSYDAIERNMEGLAKMIPSLDEEFQRSAADYYIETDRLKRARTEAQAVVAQSQSLLCDIEAAISQRNIYALYAQFQNFTQSSLARRPALLDSNQQNGIVVNRRNHYHPRNQQRITQNGAIAKPKRNRRRNRNRRPQNTINSTSIVYMFNGQSGGQRSTGAGGVTAPVDEKENERVGLLDTVLSPIRSLPPVKSEPRDWSSLAYSDGAAKVSVKREPHSSLSAALKTEPLF